MNDHADMARAYFGTTREDARQQAWNDMDALYRQNVELREALTAVVSALEDVGMSGSLAHEIASKALGGK